MEPRATTYRRIAVATLLGLLMLPLLPVARDGRTLPDTTPELFLSADPALALEERSLLDSAIARVLSVPESDRNVRVIFHSLRDRFFREYSATATMGETLREGRFNCVGSTALTALVLQAAGIPGRIIETPRHIFLQVDRDGHCLRLETTSDGRALFRSPRKDLEWTREINLSQLAALQRYNSGLAALDRSETTAAFDLFAGAHQLYPDTRILEMLEHTAAEESRLGLRLLRRGDLPEARPHLERALQVRPDRSILRKALAAVLLHDIESRPGHLANLISLEASLARYPFLTTVREVRQVHSDLLLAVAWDNFEKDDTGSGMARLREFERRYATAPDIVQSDMAGAVYGQAWKALVRAGDEAGAEALLQRGLIFAPESASLERKREAMASGW